MVAAGLCLSVQVLVFGSPFVHAHDEHESDDHGDHHGIAVHAHLGGHEHADHLANGSAVEPEPAHEGAIYLPTFIAEPLSAFDLPAGAPQSFELNVPEETAGFVAVAVSHGHDPPLVDAIPPRAPPAAPTFI